MKTLTDFNRRVINLKGSTVDEVIPDFYKSEYPNLITFLEKYYQFMDSDADYNFAATINALYENRDIEDTSIPNLDLILKEIGQGLLNTNFFLDPRFATRLVANFYKVKGSLYSAEGFFRGFYGSETTIEYPKRNIFIVGESLIGPNSLRYIQDGRLYQIYSILVKSEIPLSTWKDLYKKFVHPAGFYLGAETTLVGDGVLSTGFMPDAIPLDSNAFNIISFSTQASVEGVGSIEVAGLYDSSGTFTKYSLVDVIDNYTTITAAQLAGQYTDLADLINYSSPTFDEDSSIGVDLSNTVETMDQNRSFWWSDDSDVYQSQLP
jgi:hypothetical protein